MMYVLAYDIGTTGVKTCLYSIDKTIELTAGAYAGYGLYMMQNGGAEQDADEWWKALCETTKEVFTKTDVKPKDISGISFCSQMQGLVLVDKEGNAVRRPMSYMDQRGTEQFAACMGKGLIKISDCNAFKLIKSIRINCAASTSVKDPVWKYKWVEKNEPDVFKKVHKWLDVKEYLITRCTGRFVMTEDSAFATMLLDTRKRHKGWSNALVKLYGVNPDHLPEIISCTDKAGTLTEKAAKDLGLCAGTAVYGGGGDATLIGVGAGCTKPGQTHVYSGTSGWVSTVVDRQVVDVISMIAGVVAASPGRYNYFAEMETAGKCLEWVKNHLALDEIGIYLEKKNVTEGLDAVYKSLYDYLSKVIEKANPGSDGVIFTPWLHGNRCPFEDPNAAGMFFNLKIDTGKTEMIRSVIEGVCFHVRWMLECEEKKVKTSAAVRFVGGGAISPVTCQILADVTGRTIETVSGVQDVGATGAAMLVAVGSGIYASLDEASALVRIENIYKPNPENKKVYDRNYEVFKRLYRANAENFRELNAETFE